MPIELILIEAHYPGRAAVLAGFILLGDGLQGETTGNRTAKVNLLKNWSFVPNEEDREVLEGMEECIRSLLEDDVERGIKTLEGASNVLRFSDPLQVLGGMTDLAGLSLELNRLLLAADSGGRCRSASA